MVFILFIISSSTCSGNEEKKSTLSLSLILFYSADKNFHTHIYSSVLFIFFVYSNWTNLSFCVVLVLFFAFSYTKALTQYRRLCTPESGFQSAISKQSFLLPFSLLCVHKDRKQREVIGKKSEVIYLVSKKKKKREENWKGK